MSAKMIEVEVRNVYGRPAIYPLNEAARLAAEMKGTKTLTQNDLRILAKLGHRIRELTPAKLDSTGGVK